MLRKLLAVPRRHYVSHVELEALKQKYGDSYWQKLKMWMKYFQHRTSVGLSDMKHDLARYYVELRNLENPTQQQLEEAYRIRFDLSKLPPTFILGMLPFGFLLVAGYIQFFPDALPSWFEVDEVHYTKQKEYLRVKHEAFQRLLGDISDQKDLDVDEIEYEKLVLVAEAISGKSIDGTRMLSKLLRRPISVRSRPMQYLSSLLLKAQLKYYLHYDPTLHRVQDLPFKDKLNYKLRALKKLRLVHYQESSSTDQPNDS